MSNTPTNEATPKPVINLFGKQYNYHDTFALDDSNLAKTIENYGRAGHKCVKKKNAADHALVDLYVKQSK